MNPLMSAKQTPQKEELQQMYKQFQSDPSAFLAKAHLSVPEEYQSSPRSMVEYLARTGKVPAQLIPQVNAMLGR